MPNGAQRGRTLPPEADEASSGVIITTAVPVVISTILTVEGLSSISLSVEINALARLLPLTESISSAFAGNFLITAVTESSSAIFLTNLIMGEADRDRAKIKEACAPLARVVKKSRVLILKTFIGANLSVFRHEE